ncbi:hypothetical protein [Ferruginibacter profundus]
MKRLLLFLCLLFLGQLAIAQMAALNLSELSYVPKQKFDTYISKKGFAFVGTSYKTDTIARDFDYKRTPKDTIPVQRTVTSFSTKEDFCLVYRTTSTDEFQKIKADIKKEGFFCNREKDSLTAPFLLYQHNDVTVNISSKTIDTLTEYSFTVRKQELPKPKEISFAEDLSVFNSHEYLRFYFGEQNVKKDIYYLSDQKVGKCSVLFPNTNRQVVFLWDDEANNCNLSKIYIGGQLMAESNLQYENNIPENLWRLKSGIRPGMSLYQLRKLNDAAFNFNGGNSSNTGMVATDSTGKLDFKRESVILGCMNCTDPAFSKKKIMNSDDAIEEERILFVQTIILEPVKIKPAEK